MSLLSSFFVQNKIIIFHFLNFRSIELNRDRNVEHKGISGIRYATDEKVFASVLKNPKNYCYCPQSIRGITHFGGCLKSGVIELSSCQGKSDFVSEKNFYKLI